MVLLYVMQARWRREVVMEGSYRIIVAPVGAQYTDEVRGTPSMRRMHACMTISPGNPVYTMLVVITLAR